MSTLAKKFTAAAGDIHFDVDPDDPIVCLNCDCACIAVELLLDVNGGLHCPDCSSTDIKRD